MNLLPSCQPSVSIRPSPPFEGARLRPSTCAPFVRVISVASLIGRCLHSAIKQVRRGGDCYPHEQRQWQHATSGDASVYLSSEASKPKDWCLATADLFSGEPGLMLIAMHLDGEEGCWRRGIFSPSLWKDILQTEVVPFQLRGNFVVRFLLLVGAHAALFAFILLIAWV